MFWDDLSDRLAERDMERKFGREAIEAMDGEKRFKELMAISGKYEEEFEKHGIGRLEVSSRAEGNWASTEQCRDRLAPTAHVRYEKKLPPQARRDWMLVETTLGHNTTD